MKLLNKVVSNHIYILVVILIIGFYLRVFSLTDIPPGMHIDEVQIGYNAYSIMQTGKDEMGNFFPTHLAIWGYQRPLSAVYLTIPTIFIFGLNELGTRLSISIIGFLTIILVYLLTQKIFSDRRLSLVTTFLFSLSPWHIILSRVTSEAVVSLAFYVLGTLFCFLLYSTNRIRFLFFAYLSFVVSFFSYHSTRITIPFLLLFFIILSFKNKLKNTVILFIIILLAYCLFPLLPNISTSMGRFSQVSIFNEQGTKLLMEEQIREDGNDSPVFVTRLFHNKLMNFSLKLLNNLTQYLSPQFIIFDGSLPIRFHIPNMGLLYFIEFPFLLWGVIVLFSKKFSPQSWSKYFIFLWIFLGLFSSILTLEETPNVQRALFILPALQWITALGWIDIYSKFQKNYRYLFLVSLFILFVWNFFYFIHQYTVHTITHRPWYRFAEMKELSLFLFEQRKNYSRIITTFNSTEPYIFYIFYNKINPKEFQNTYITKGQETAWNKIDTITVSRRDCPVIPKEERTQDTLVIYKVQCFFPLGSRVVKKITFPDGETTFVAVDFPKDYKILDKDLKYEPDLIIN